MFLCLLGKVVGYLFYSKWPREVNWWIYPNHIPHNAQGKKRRATKNTQAWVFSVNFAEFCLSPSFLSLGMTTTLITLIMNIDWTDSYWGVGVDMLKSMKFGNLLVSFQFQDNLIRSIKVDLYEILLEDCFRSNLQEISKFSLVLQFNQFLF